MSQALILASTKTQYDKRLFIESQVQYMKITSSEHLVCINCPECQNKKQFMYSTSSEVVIFMQWTCNSMNNLSSYCGLVHAKIRSSDKNLPVLNANHRNVVELRERERKKIIKLVENCGNVCVNFCVKKWLEWICYIFPKQLLLHVFITYIVLVCNAVKNLFTKAHSQNLFAEKL